LAISPNIENQCHLLADGAKVDMSGNQQSLGLPCLGFI